MKKGMTIVCLMLVIFTSLSAAPRRRFVKATGESAHLFQAYFRDVPINSSSYGDIGLQYDDYDFFSHLFVGGKLGLMVNRDFEIDGAVGLINVSPEWGDSESGLSDMLINCKYAVSRGRTPIALGGYITLPVGSEDVGAGNLDFGFFAALRHLFPGGTNLTATAGLDFLETYKDRETVFVLGGGLIFPVGRRTNIVTELMMKTRIDYMMLSGGIDHRIGGGHLRAALGFGLDDGAPDLTVMGSYQFSF